MRFPEVFLEMGQLAARLGVSKINELPGCWEHQIDAQWWIAVNGHATSTKCSKGVAVAPYSIYVEFNGWPAGIIDPRGGCIAAGTDANEDTLLAAMRAAPLTPPEQQG